MPCPCASLWPTPVHRIPHRFGPYRSISLFVASSFLVVACHPTHHPPRDRGSHCCCCRLFAGGWPICFVRSIWSLLVISIAPFSMPPPAFYSGLSVGPFVTKVRHPRPFFIFVSRPPEAVSHAHIFTPFTHFSSSRPTNGPRAARRPRAGVRVRSPSARHARWFPPFHFTTVLPRIVQLLLQSPHCSPCCPPTYISPYTRCFRSSPPILQSHSVTSRSAHASRLCQSQQAFLFVVSLCQSSQSSQSDH